MKLLLPAFMFVQGFKIDLILSHFINNFDLISSQ